MRYASGDGRRREAVRAHPTLNGIDYLEVLDGDAPKGIPRRRTLLVHCFKQIDPIPPFGAVRIEGGERIRPVRVVWVARGDVLPKGEELKLPDADRVLVVRTDRAGDFSPYALTLDTDGAFDPKLRAVTFGFRVECPSDFDCRCEPRCPSAAPAEPVLDYLARDYASLRRLLFDRMALLLPDWRERNPADLGVALVELLAYVGDQLAYRQDAAATEAYLGTARLRTSVRRHARLVDYRMHDGCNARTWVQILVDRDVHAVEGVPAVPAGTALLTRVAGLHGRLAPDSPEYHRARAAGAQVFETMQPVESLWAAHTALRLHTWGERDYCLPAGSTRATLRGALPDLAVGQVLVLEETLGPRTGRAQDADPSHRHAVRLTGVRTGADPVGGRFDDPPGSTDSLEVTEIEWAQADALPFPLCVSARTDAEHGGRWVETAVARGNIVLADHGESIRDETLASDLRLRRGPVTQAGHVSTDTDAAAALRWPMDTVLPVVSPDGGWRPRRDLLENGPFDRVFVAEVDDGGRTRLRFGDGHYGRGPEPGVPLRAKYRVGNGSAGNLGVETLAHLVLGNPDVAGVRNPLAAVGGTDPETIERVRQSAPYAFATQERAVTAEDYAEVAQRHPEVQRAAATLRWTGSWRTVFITVDRFGGGPVDAAFVAQLRQHLERYRLAGYDLEIDGPRFVPLEVALTVCVAPGHRRRVAAELLAVLGSGTRPDGRPGLFHPDNLTFGQTVYLSPVYAAAQAVPGVRSVQVTTFGRRDQSGSKALVAGMLPLHRLEIARLDNDPNRPERGLLRLTLEGGA